MGDLLVQTAFSAQAVWTHSDWISLGGFGATVVGLWVAVHQLRKTAKATTATSQAVVRTERRMARSHLLLLLPLLELAKQDLDDLAVDTNASREFAVRTLSSLQRLAGDVLTLLSQQEQPDKMLLDTLREVTSLASRAKSQLIEDRRIMPKTATKALRPVLEDATRHLRATSLDLGLAPVGG